MMETTVMTLLVCVSIKVSNKVRIGTINVKQVEQRIIVPILHFRENCGGSKSKYIMDANVVSKSNVSNFSIKWNP